MALSDLRLTIYNTETKEKKAVHPQNGKQLKLYTCGPTVYNYAHIGNFRTYVAEDVLKRALRYFGLPIFHVMNITDVEDKTIKGSLENNLPLKEYTKPFTDAFFEDCKTLNIDPADQYPKATDYIKEMIEMIETLIEKDHAYVGSDKSVYFSIKSFPQYGRLSHLKLAELKTGASERLDDEYDKENASDFVLWKAYDEKRDGKVYWESPFGKGRPGWHMECSCMAIKLLGVSVDIHCGGVDNIFPHHENEIAQSEGCTDKCFVHHWFHVEHLVVDGKKMSKSAKNFYTLRDLLEKGYTGRQLRYLLMQTHYKNQLNFTFEGLEGAKSSLDRIDSFIARLDRIDDLPSKEIEDLCKEYEYQFSKAIADDLNISSALGAFYEFLRKANAFIDEHNRSPKQSIWSLLKRFDEILGIIFFKKEEKIDQEIIEALEKREEARKARDFALADKLRDFIYAQGYEIEDTPKGARVKRR